MILLALLLTTLGVSDLAAPRDSLVLPAAKRGSSRDEALRRARLLLRGLVAAGAVLAVGVWGTGLSWWWALAILAVVAAWLFSTTPTRRKGSTGVRDYPWPLVGLGTIAIAALAASPIVPSAAGWLPDWFATLRIAAVQGSDFERFAFAVGCVLVLIETANVAVRMVLTSSVSGIAKAEQELRGGRILGPIERIFIFAMALSGEYLAISAVIAAKSILRFPEVSKEGGHGSRAEYVLVGSFVSWGIALLFVPLFQ
jgi:hypothetical protein